jgi:glycerol uptake facilitator protein
MFRKNTLAMLVSEFLGTGLLALTVLAMLRSQGGTFNTAAAAGLIVGLMVLAVGAISGAVLNPAVTVGLWSVRKLRSLQALSYILVQFAGAAAAWYAFVYFTKIDTSTIKHEDLTKMSGRVFFAELLGTFVFCFAIAAALYQRLSSGVKAFVIGGGLMLGIVAASLGSAGAVNPAVAFAIQQWNVWAYMLAPLLGAVLGFTLYNLLFVQTELAEVAEAREEVAAVAVTESVVTRSAAKPVRATAKKTPAKKAPARKRVATKK